MAYFTERYTVDIHTETAAQSMFRADANLQLLPLKGFL